MPTQRLASFQDFCNFAKGAQNLSSQDERGVAVGMMLDGLGVRIANYILKSTQFPLYQYASDGVSGAAEFYGIEHYGKHKRNLIRLFRPFNIASITSVTDNQTLLTSDLYSLDPKNGSLWRLNGMFYPQPLAVQVVYTAGYPAIGAGNTAKLGVPSDLNIACLQQAQFEFNAREPGGVPVGANTISRSDGSIVIQPQNWIKSVQNILDQYRR